jgi:hypothetical protein
LKDVTYLVYCWDIEGAQRSDEELLLYTLRAKVKSPPGQMPVLDQHRCSQDPELIFFPSDHRRLRFTAIADIEIAVPAFDTRI